jgi:hypothetical protein
MESRLVIQNPWWAERANIYSDEKVKEALARKHKLLYDFEEGNFLIVGPRQVGKTTYIKLLIEGLLKKGDPRSILYFACDLLKDKDEIVRVIESFDSISPKPSHVFLDEVTFVGEWERAVKFLLDSPLSRGKHIYVTGSSSIGLKKERFPGRKIKQKEFLPLSFRSFCGLFGSDELRNTLKGLRARGLKAKEIFELGKELVPFSGEVKRLFHSYLECGGYPRACFELVEEGRIKEETYRACFDAVVFDVTKLGRSEKTCSSILQGVLRRYGSKFSLNSLAKEMEVGSHLTVRDYLELMEGLYVARSYHQLDPNRGVVLFRKERKVYYIDPFLCRVFSKYLHSEVPVPSIVEGVVGEHLMRRYGEVHILAGKREVDFVVGGAGVEVKWQERVDAKDFPRVGLKDKILLCREGVRYVEERNLTIVPVPLFLLGIS